MDIFIRAPWLAFAMGAIFFAIAGSVTSRTAIATAVVWCCYGVYEYLMRFRMLCSGECNIRVDLLLIYPILLILSTVAVVGVLTRQRT